MQNFQDTFEKRKRSFISAFSICMTVPLIADLMKNVCFDETSVPLIADRWPIL